MSGWKSIKTAPRDGTWVLLRGGSTEESNSCDDPYEDNRPVVARYNQPSRAWVFAWWDGAWRSRYDDPKEWMEVPE